MQKEAETKADKSRGGESTLAVDRNGKERAKDERRERDGIPESGEGLE